MDAQNIICPVCGYVWKDPHAIFDRPCPHCEYDYGKYGEVDYSMVPWAILGPKARKIMKENRRRVKNRLGIAVAVLFLVSLILSNLMGDFGIGLSLLLLASYIIYYAAQMKRHGVAFLGGDEAGGTDTITKRKNPVLFQVGVWGCYLLVIWFAVMGIYLIRHS